MTDLLAQRTEADGDPYEILERAGLRERADEINQRARALDKLEPGESPIDRLDAAGPQNAVWILAVLA